jgi:hypothetical protein
VVEGLVTGSVVVFLRTVRPELLTLLVTDAFRAEEYSGE